LLAALPPNKEEINTFLGFLIEQIKKLGVEIHLNCEVTPEFVVQQKPDVVVIATGGRQVQPKNIPIDPKIRCLAAWEILGGEEKNLSQKVVVLGGGFVAAEIADFMWQRRMAEEITIIEMREAIAFDLDPTFRQMLIERLEGSGVKMITNFLIREVTATEVIGRDVKTNLLTRIQADTVVMALGTESMDFPAEAIKKAGMKVLSIGDAKEPHGIAEAVRDGYLAGIYI
jgi:pyruvate/2-oxoglutarate dehydrogenase complex dihydrolipoamide dehydrogenase (E3) component